MNLDSRQALKASRHVGVVISQRKGRLRLAVTGAVMALLAAVIAVVASPSPSYASATQCSGSPLAVQACVEVVGTGLHVDKVRSYIKIGPNYGGDFDQELWVGSSYYWICCGASYWGQQTVYGPWHNINANFANNTGACATVRQYPSTRLQTACVTIHN